MDFHAKFGGVEAALARLHNIASDKRTAFQARLKNFLRLGLVSDVKAGRGKAASYNAGHVLLLALALEMTQVGVGPDAAVRIIQGNMRSITKAVKASISPSGGLPAENWSPAIIYFDPHSMQALSEYPLDPVSIIFCDAENFRKNFRSIIVDNQRLAVISITRLILRICETIAEPEAIKKMALDRFFAQALYDWAERYHDLNPQT